jgi:hypothetical protein
MAGEIEASRVKARDTDDCDIPSACATARAVTGGPRRRYATSSSEPIADPARILAIIPRRFVRNSGGPADPPAVYGPKNSRLRKDENNIRRL